MNGENGTLSSDLNLLEEAGKYDWILAQDCSFPYWITKVIGERGSLLGFHTVLVPPHQLEMEVGYACHLLIHITLSSHLPRRTAVPALPTVAMQALVYSLFREGCDLGIKVVDCSETDFSVRNFTSCFLCI